MKVTLVRASGRPVNIDNIQAYEQEFRTQYDKVLAHVGVNEQSIMNEDTGTRINKLLNRIQKILLKKYPVQEEVQLPKSQRAWSKLVAQVGPVAVATRLDKAGVALVIMDAEFNPGE